MLIVCIQNTTRKAVAKQKKKGERQAAVLAMELRSEKLSLEQLRGASQLLLDSVWHISPRGKQVKQITVEDVPRRIAEVHAHIAQSVDDQKQIAVDEARRAISMHLPEIDTYPTATLTEAVASALSDRLTEREGELSASLRAAEARERKLRCKLEHALTKVQSIATPVRLESPVRADVALDGIERMREDWENQRTQLDLKMSELTRGLSSTLETGFRTPRPGRL
jgi:hypothetical protein